MPNASWRSCTRAAPSLRSAGPRSGALRAGFARRRSLQVAGRGRDARLGVGAARTRQCPLDPQTVNDTLGVLLKYQDDIVRMEGSEAKRILDQIKDEIRHDGSAWLSIAAPSGRLAAEHHVFRARAREAGMPVGPGAVTRCARCGALPARSGRGRISTGRSMCLRQTPRPQGTLRSGVSCVLEEAQDAGAVDATHVPADRPQGRRKVEAGGLRRLAEAMFDQHAERSRTEARFTRDRRELHCSAPTKYCAPRTSSR